MLLRKAKRIPIALCDPYEMRISKEAQIDNYKRRDLSKFPPIAVTLKPDGRYHIMNGHHRYYARLDKGYKTIMAWVMPQRKGVWGCDDGVYVVWRGRVINYDRHMWSKDVHHRLERFPTLDEYVREEEYNCKRSTD